MRKEYVMTQEQVDKIMHACRPVNMIALQCGNPPGRQENANDAWQSLGKEMGFKYMTVRPNGKGKRFFRTDRFGKNSSRSN